MKTLAEIKEIYGQPLTGKSDIRMAYHTDTSTRERIAKLNCELNGIVRAKREELGLSNVRPLNLSSENAENLRESIKSDGRWKDRFNELIGVLSPGSEGTELEKYINLPWWNSVQLFRTGDKYLPNEKSLAVDAELSHSYITQLIRARKVPGPRKDPMSISNVLITSDGLLVLGWRGGHTYSDTLMSVPAGSVEYHSGENPLFETLYAEHFEETGLARDSFESTELIGKIHDNTLADQSLYVFRSRTKLSFPELLDVWIHSIDHREHKYLIPFKDDPQYMLDQIRQHTYDPSKTDPERPSVTARDNIGSILPPCAASLLLHYAQREGAQWGLKAERLLNESYAFEC